MNVKRQLSVVLSLVMLLSILAVPAYAAESAFADVAVNAYYADAVAWALKNNITSGTSATTFSPDTTCTKAQIITFIWRANGSPEPDLEKINAVEHNPFPDLNGTEYYFKAAQWAFTKGMVAGGMNFNGNEPCSRSLAVLYLWEVEGEPVPNTQASFTDIIRALHSLDAISWAVEAGITSGTSATTFSPDATCTRGQIVTFLYRAMGKSNGSGGQTQQSGGQQQQTQTSEGQQSDATLDDLEAALKALDQQGYISSDRGRNLTDEEKALLAGSLELAP